MFFSHSNRVLSVLLSVLRKVSYLSILLAILAIHYGERGLGGGVLGFGIGIFLLFGVCSERRIAKSFQVRFSLFWHIYAHTSKSISLHKRSNILQRTLANHSPPDPGPALYMPRYFSFCQTHMHGFPLLHQIG